MAHSFNLPKSSVIKGLGWLGERGGPCCLEVHPRVAQPSNHTIAACRPATGDTQPGHSTRPTAAVGIPFVRVAILMAVIAGCAAAGDPDPAASSGTAVSTAPNASSSTPLVYNQQAKSVAQYGITWTFDKPHAVGQFVTGDWWVIGPATVVSVTPSAGPAPEETTSREVKSIYGATAMVDDRRMRNGSMIAYCSKTHPHVMRPSGNSIVTGRQAVGDTQLDRRPVQDLRDPQ